MLPEDARADPAGRLADVMRKHGWATFRPELEAAFTATTKESRGRNMALLEAIATAKPGKKAGWEETGTRAGGGPGRGDRGRGRQAADVRVVSQEDRPAWVAGLTRGLLAAGVSGPLERFVDHMLGQPKGTTCARRSFRRWWSHGRGWRRTSRSRAPGCRVCWTPAGRSWRR